MVNISGSVSSKRNSLLFWTGLKYSESTKWGHWEFPYKTDSWPKYKLKNTEWSTLAMTHGGYLAQSCSSRDSSRVPHPGSSGRYPRRSPNGSGQPLSVLHPQHSTEVLLVFRGNLLCSSLCPWAWHWTPLSTVWFCLFALFVQKFMNIDEISWVSQSHTRGAPLSWSSLWPVVGFSPYVHLSCVLGSPETDTVLQMLPHQCCIGAMHHLPPVAANTNPNRLKNNVN